MKDFDLRGKDYLTREEAAHYACISLRQWDAVRRMRGIDPIQWAGKMVYRRDDIQRAIEACRQSSNEESRGISTGQRTAKSSAGLLGLSQRQRQERLRDSSVTNLPAIG